MKKLFLGLVLASLMTTIVGASVASFPDVKSTDWFYDDVMNMVDWGVIEGNDDGTFKPGNNVNRAELSAMWNRYDERVHTGDLTYELMDAYDDLTDTINFSTYVYAQNLRMVQLVLDTGLYDSSSSADDYSTCFALQTTDNEIQVVYEWITGGTFDDLLNGDYSWIKELADDQMANFYTEDDCNDLWE